MKPRKNKSGVVPIYDESLKIAVARDYLTGNLSYSQVAEKYSLPGGDVVRYFVKWYQKNCQNEISQPIGSPQTTNVQASGSQDQRKFEQELSDAD